MDPLKQALKQAVITRYEGMVRDLKKGYDENLLAANWWGKLHIVLGISAALSSSAGAVFTFFDGSKILVVSLALLSTLLASGLTFLNPSNREGKRRSTALLFLIELNRLEDAKLITNYSSLSEVEILQKLQEMSSRIENLVKESSRVLISNL
ncbi:hypothetical protein [Leptolyngbya sp. 7M]|uniref:hypothetical protein n=1 Tax=Leptolyngbya sp. 7M TaxID=2812896 RepID=UPI001B8D6CC9|nr:hypothetical protein [Leptolyngbya sp. 7M]QYO67118.1 hypothetical protein JVX88_10085 [Leptolyngbya sp. 7M]